MQEFNDTSITDIILGARKEFREKFNIELEEWGEGKARLSLPINSPEYWNIFDIPYGGILFHMADLAAGIAVITTGRIGMTVSSNAEYLNGSKKATELRSFGEVTKVGRSLSFADAFVTDQDDTLLCRFRFIFKNR